MTEQGLIKVTLVGYAIAFFGGIFLAIDHGWLVGILSAYVIALLIDIRYSLGRMKND